MGQDRERHGQGRAPFDLAAAHKIFATFQDAAAKMPALFPDNSKTGGDTAADPKIWENMADFKAKFAKFGDDAKAADASVKDLDSFKAVDGRYWQERLRRLPSDLPPQEELNPHD